MIEIYKNTLFRVVLFSAISLPAFSNNLPYRIVGLDNAAHLHRAVPDNTYIQAGAFGSKANAVAFQKKLRATLSVPVEVQHSGGFYRVMIGPLHSTAQVRTVAQTALGAPVRMSQPAPFKKQAIKVEKKVVLVDKDGFSLQPPRKDGFFASIDAGIYAGKSTNAMMVNNGSGFPVPANMDTYTGGNSNTPATVGFTVGYFSETANSWFPAWSAGLRYKYLFSNNMRGEVIQYSTPKYTNYDYQWSTNANVLLAQGKLNLKPFSLFLPYVSGGIGVAINHSSSYSETPLAGITPRVSPDFGAHAQSQFAWTAGVGLDYRFNPNIVLSAGYEFQSFGKVQSGPGTVEWATERLMQGGLQSNGALFSLTYGLER